MTLKWMCFDVLVFDIERAERGSKQADNLNIDFNSLETTAIRKCYIMDRDLISIVAITPIYIQGFKVDGHKKELCEIVIDKSQEGISRRDYSYIVGSPEEIMKRIDKQIDMWTQEYQKEEEELIASFEKFEKKPVPKKIKTNIVI